MNATAAKFAPQSPLATLESKVSPDAIREARPDGVKTGQSVNFSGQYLYNRLIEDSQEERTRLDIVRSAVKQVDVAQWKKSLADMVAIAKTHGPERLKVAQNTQSALRVIYGALKFAPEQLTALGATEKDGYNVMQTMARKALDTNGIKWDGTEKPPADVKQERARVSEEREILNEIQAANPILKGESITDYTKRCLAMYDRQLIVHEQNKRQKQIDDLALLVINKDLDNAEVIAHRIIELLPEAFAARDKLIVEEQEKQMQVLANQEEELKTVH